MIQLNIDASTRGNQPSHSWRRSLVAIRAMRHRHVIASRWKAADRFEAARNLKPVYADTFEPEISDLFRVVRFIRDSDGKVSGFELADSRVRALRVTRTF